jgi:hypothetical protein
VLGSADGTAWTLIDTRQDLAVWASATEVRTFTLAARPQAFLFYRIVINQLSGSDTIVELAEWVLFGDSAAHAPTTATEWPPFPMTAATTSIMGGDYVATASSGGGSVVAWKAFDKDSGTWWSSASGGYVVDTPYSGSFSTIAGGVTYFGEWIQLQLPNATQISGYSVNRRSPNFSNPTSWILFGSNDGTTWTILHQRTTSMSTFVHGVTSTSKYSFLRIAFLQMTATLVNASSSTINIAEISFTDATVPSITNLYADEKGNLALTPAIGQPLADWLGTDVGYVKTWYDQSGAGKHMEQATASLQPTMNLATTPASIAFGGNGTVSGQYLFNSAFTHNFGTNHSYTIRAVLENNVGGCLLYKGMNGFLFNQGGIKKWYLATPNGTIDVEQLKTGNYPNLVGYAEGFVFGQTPITSAKTSVTWDSSAVSSMVLYINGVATSVSYNTRMAISDPGTYLYIGTGGYASFYKGNLHELIIYSTPLAVGDITTLG